MKQAIRRKVLEDRGRLSPEERRAKSAAIENRLFNLPAFTSAPVVLFFASFRSEVETGHMIGRALAEGKRVVLPRVKGKELELIEIRNFELDVAPGAWGIPEPERGTRTDRRDIRLIVVPGAAFDGQGNRIGYGAGFYDKLLQTYTGRTVALAFELQIVPGVPADSHDIPVQTIVTETRVIETNARVATDEH